MNYKGKIIHGFLINRTKLFQKTIESGDVCIVDTYVFLFMKIKW